MTTDARITETHSAWVVLLRERAYKIKKPVVLDILDFSTREAREAIVHREVELNRRLALDALHIRSRRASLEPRERVETETEGEQHSETYVEHGPAGDEGVDEQYGTTERANDGYGTRRSEWPWLGGVAAVPPAS